MSLDDVAELGPGSRAEVIAAQSTLDVWQIFSSYQQPPAVIGVHGDEAIAELPAFPRPQSADMPPIIPLNDGLNTRRPRSDLARRLMPDSSLLLLPEEPSYSVHLQPQQPPLKRPRLISEEFLHPLPVDIATPPQQRSLSGRLVTEASLLRAQEASLAWEELRQTGSVYRGHLPSLMSLGESRGSGIREERAPVPAVLHPELLG